MQKLKVFWATMPKIVVSNAFGYSYFNQTLHKLTEQAFERDEGADISLQLCPADRFQVLRFKKNVLFTMWEFDDLPESYIKAINSAYAIIVPSAYCRDVFKKYLLHNRIYVCHLGIDPVVYKFHQRKVPTSVLPKPLTGKEKFRFLWVSAPNPRKGYEYVLQAIGVFEKCPDVEIYIKSTTIKMTWWQTIKSIFKHRKEIVRTDRGRWYHWKRILGRLPNPHLANKLKIYGQYKNIYFDTRKLMIEELRDLYNSAHCFLLPHLGEGWGLTLSEAMATGCPSIANPETGCKDFFNEDVGFPLKTEVKTVDLRDYQGLQTTGHFPETGDFIETMFKVIYNYQDALKRGKKASERMHAKFTWQLSADRLVQILNEIDKS